ncbi:MAG: hypothetical protein JWL76_1620 [Thermoleophilia bacterium]|nr:hypothetical protein [Thermoleophilia bacterium]
MIGLLAEQLLAVAAALVIFCLPGWALSRVLELHLRMPTVSMPAVTFTLGLGIWTIVLLPALALELSIGWTLVAYAVVSACVIVLMRVREARRGHAKRGRAAFAGWTIAAIALSCLAALALRTRMAFDTLFHVGLVRRIAELPHPTFDNLDRVVGAGVNPAYALPIWQAGMAAIARVTGLDAATVVEAMAVIGVLLASCAAGALGRAVTGTVYGEIAGVSAYAWLRVFNPRRELEGDGVAYAALPGNIALDVMLVLALVVAVQLMRGRAKRDGALVALGAVAIVLLIVLHANYVVYLAIIGAGTVLWLLAAGPWTAAIARRLALVAATFVVPGLVAFAAVLPLLMLLEHFGAPMETRIDYHLTTFHGVEFIRPGHLYDWFAAPGLLGMLVLPWAAWRARGVSRALIGGGSLAVLAFALVPQLVDLLGTSGSLTLSLRLPRPLGVLLVAAAAVAVPDLVRRGAGLASRASVARGHAVGWVVRLAPLVAIAVLCAAYGYPLVRREPPQYGWNWPTIVALVGLLVVLVAALRSRGATNADAAATMPSSRMSRDPRPADYVLTTKVFGLAILAIAIAMLPSGYKSLRRAAWQSREVVAAYRADDLRCYDGVQAALRDLPPGDVLLTDPVTAYGAQALAPMRVVGDYKVWNGSTDTNRIERRLQLLRATFDSKVAERAGGGLARLASDFGVQYVLVSRGEVEPPLGSDLGSYDAVGLRAVLDSGDIGATRVAAGNGRFDANAEPEDVEACDLELWRIDGSERSLEIERDPHHANDSAPA